MKFSVVINRWAIFYFFIQNLSEWHFSNRQDYNILWRDELGRFSSEEENALKQFKEIHLRYPFGKLYLGRQFFLEENPWTVLEKKLSREDFINLKNVFSSLEEKFNLLWEKEFSLLTHWQKELGVRINEPKLIKSITDILNVLFNSPPSREEVKIYLLFSTPDGGASTDGQSIKVEISRYPINDVNRALGIIWHETIHLCFERQSFLLLLNKKYPNDSDAVNLIREATNSSLFPNGALGIKFFSNKRNLLNTKIPQKYNEKLLVLTNKYIDENKSFDNEYIEAIYNLISGIKGILK